MTKRNGAPRKPQTHFEQIPLEVVKKIAEEDLPKDKKKPGTGKLSVEPASRKKG